MMHKRRNYARFLQGWLMVLVFIGIQKSAIAKNYGIKILDENRDQITDTLYCGNTYFVQWPVESCEDYDIVRIQLNIENYLFAEIDSTRWRKYVVDSFSTLGGSDLDFFETTFVMPDSAICLKPTASFLIADFKTNTTIIKDRGFYRIPPQIHINDPITFDTLCADFNLFVKLDARGLFDNRTKIEIVNDNNESWEPKVINENPNDIEIEDWWNDNWTLPAHNAKIKIIKYLLHSSSRQFADSVSSLIIYKKVKIDAANTDINQTWRQNSTYPIPLRVSNGISPLKWSIADLKPDSTEFTFDSDTAHICTLYVTPESHSGFSFDAQVESQAPNDEDSIHFDVTVVPDLKILSDTLKPAFVGDYYEDTLKASDSTNLNWDCKNLLAGFSLDSTSGIIKCTSVQHNEAPDTLDLLVAVGSDSPGIEDLDTNNVYLLIYQPLTIVPDSQFTARQGCLFSDQFFYSSSNPPVSWSISDAENLPDSFNLDSTNGAFSFTPKEANTIKFKVVAKDQSPRFASMNVTIQVDPNKLEILLPAGSLYCRRNDTLKITLTTNSTVSSGQKWSLIDSLDWAKILEGDTLQIIPPDSAPFEQMITVQVCEGDSGCCITDTLTILIYNNKEISQTSSLYLINGNNAEAEFKIADETGRVHKGIVTDWDYEGFPSWCHFSPTSGSNDILHLTVDWQDALSSFSDTLKALLDDGDTLEFVVEMTFKEIEIQNESSNTISYGDEFTLNWSKQGEIKKINVELLMNQKDSVYIAATDSTSFSFTVNGPAGTHTLIVSDSSNPQIFDTLSVEFTIAPIMDTLKFYDRQYGLISFAIDDINLSVSNILTQLIGSKKYDKEKARIYAARDNMLIEYDKGQPGDFVLKPGHSLLISTEGDHALAKQGNAMLDNSFSIELRNGWNFLSNPYPFGLYPDSDIVVENASLDPLGINKVKYWKYDEYWIMSDSLESGAGFAVNIHDAAENAKLVIHPNWRNLYPQALEVGGKIAAQASSVQAEKPVGDELWEIELAVSGGSETDSCNVFGIWEGNDGRDMFGLANRPPSPKKKMELQIRSMEKKDRLWIWNLELLNASSEKMIYTPKLGRSFSEEYSVSLFDEETLQFYPLKQSETIIKSSGRFFKLIVTDKSISETLALLEPATFGLRASYPNPFNSIITLEYSLPSAGALNISVFDILGRHIKTLVGERVDAGYHNIKWDALDENGIPVASGIYIVKIKFGKFEKVQKISLVR